MERIALKDLCFDAQIRQRIDDNKVEEYAEMYRQGQEEAIKVVFDGKKYYVADGEHRVRAAEKAGHTDIKADIIRGTLTDAKLLNYRINKSHGVMLTPEEKKAFCIGYIKQLMEEKSDKSNYKIAEELGIGEATVRRYKEEINASSDAKPGNADRARVTGDKKNHQKSSKLRIGVNSKQRSGGFWQVYCGYLDAEKKKKNILGDYSPEVVKEAQKQKYDTAEEAKQKLDDLTDILAKQQQQKQEQKDTPPPPKEEPKQEAKEKQETPPKEEPKQEETKQEAKQDEPRQQREERQEEGYWTKKVKEKIRESDERFQEIAKEIETLSQLMEFVVGSEVFYEMLKIGHREIAKKYHADKNNGVESEKMSEANEIWNAFKKFMKRN